MNEEEVELTPQDILGQPNPMECECLYWAGIWDKEELMREKKHHPRCKYAETES